MDMFFLKKTVSFFVVLLLVFVTTTKFVAAASYVAPSQTMLFTQIERLLAETTRLQSLVVKQQQDNNFVHVSATSYTPYVSVLFPVVYESTYLVENGHLRTIIPGKSISANDAKLFTLFVNTVEEENVAKYVREWRVFYDSESDLGAFVEYMPTADAWIVGVNREGFIAGDKEVTTIFSNLFIHELAHIVLSEKPYFETYFAGNFWTTADTQHGVEVEQTAIDSRFETLNHYYQNNATRFVSDYATLNPKEDIAETFLAFVREEKLLGVSLREQKIRAFYTEPDLVVLRGVLRANMKALGAL